MERIKKALSFSLTPLFFPPLILLITLKRQLNFIYLSRFALELSVNDNPATPLHTEADRYSGLILDDGTSCL
jgi:hypothetical protein